MVATTDVRFANRSSSLALSDFSHCSSSSQFFFRGLIWKKHKTLVLGNLNHPKSVTTCTDAYMLVGNYCVLSVYYNVDNKYYCV